MFVDKLIINGGKKLHGVVSVPVAKNALLPIIASSLMLNGETSINNCPMLSDIYASADIIRDIGSTAVFEDRKLSIFYADSDVYEISEELCVKMRSAILYLAPLLYRKQKINMYMPGGCKIGSRPIDIHIDGLRKMGAIIEINGNKISAQLPDGFKGCRYKLRLPSVGATQTLIMAASIADGITILKNCAREPEIVDLARFLNSAGAKIMGAGKNEIIIQGVSSLEGVDYTPIADRIFASTILSAVNACKGYVLIKNYPMEYMYLFENMLKKTGLKIVHFNNSAIVFKCNERKANIETHTGYYPSFSTDMGPLLSSAMVNNKGSLRLYESVFENRFSYFSQFKKLGLYCKVNNREYFQKLAKSSHNEVLYAEDLRAGAALVVAALAKNGKFDIYGINYIDRGYENIENVFVKLGADIRRISGEE